MCVLSRGLLVLTSCNVFSVWHLDARCKCSGHLPSHFVKVSEVLTCGKNCEQKSEINKDVLFQRDSNQRDKCSILTRIVDEVIWIICSASQRLKHQSVSAVVVVC